MLPALVILCREILVSGLREFLAELRVGLPVSAAGEMEDRHPDDGARLPDRRRRRADLWCPVADRPVGLWVAALLTLITGYDYMRLGLRHMAEDAPAPSKPAGTAE